MKEVSRISIATAPQDVADVKLLFQEYADFLGVDLCFQDFDREMETFPAMYDLLLIARAGNCAAGAVGLKDFGSGDCEMKRLYVRPASQGQGLGAALVSRLIEEARRRGRRRMLLDTLPKLQTAIALYRDFGFVETEPYCENPLPGVIYFALDLDANGDRRDERGAREGR